MNAPTLHHLSSRTSLSAILGLLLAAAPLALVAQSDDFDDGNDIGWTHYSPLAPYGVAGVFSFPSGGYRIQTTSPSPSPAQLGNGRAGSLRSSTSYTDFYVSVDLVDWNDALPQASGILARVGTPGLGMTTGYAFTWSRGSGATGGDMDISKLTGEVPTGVSVSGNDKYHFVPGTKYRMVFIGKGATLEGRIYALPNDITPVITMVGTDATYASGISGLVVYDNSSMANNLSDTTFDNWFSGNVEPPKLTYEFNASFHEFIIRWPLDYSAWTLQGTASLNPPISWTDLPADAIDGRYYYIEAADSGNRFFRLTKH